MIRPGRLLAIASWLLVLAGLSCTYHIGLPGAADDDGGSADETGGAQGSDATVDQFGRPWLNRPDGCSNSRLNVQQNQVEMIVALDRSTSMQQNAFDSTTRLMAAQQAIVAAIDAHPSIKFGLDQFPLSKDCSGPTWSVGDVSVQPGWYHSTDIQQEMACASGDPGCAVSSSDSPSHMSLRRCRFWYFNEGRGSASQFVLLITDQDPTCAGDASTDASLCNLAGDEVTNLRQLGVQTFIVSLNSDAQSTSCLANLPVVSALNSAGNLPQFQAATDQADLKARLEAIMAAVEVNVCRFSLPHPPENPAQVVVTTKSGSVPPDPSGQQSGWRFSDATSSEVVLSGSYCTAVISAQSDTTPGVFDCWQ